MVRRRVATIGGDPPSSTLTGQQPRRRALPSYSSSSYSDGHPHIPQPAVGFNVILKTLFLTTNIRLAAQGPLQFNHFPLSLLTLSLSPR